MVGVPNRARVDTGSCETTTERRILLARVWRRCADCTRRVPAACSGLHTWGRTRQRAQAGPAWRRRRGGRARAVRPLPSLPRLPRGCATLHTGARPTAGALRINGVHCVLRLHPHRNGRPRGDDHAEPARKAERALARTAGRSVPRPHRGRGRPGGRCDHHQGGGARLQRGLRPDPRAGAQSPARQPAFGAAGRRHDASQPLRLVAAHDPDELAHLGALEAGDRAVARLLPGRGHGDGVDVRLPDHHGGTARWATRRCGRWARWT